MDAICVVGGTGYILWEWVRFFRDGAYEFYLTADDIVYADPAHPYHMRGGFAEDCCVLFECDF